VRPHWSPDPCPEHYADGLQRKPSVPTREQLTGLTSANCMSSRGISSNRGPDVLDRRESRLRRSLLSAPSRGSSPLLPVACLGARRSSLPALAAVTLIVIAMLAGSIVRRGRRDGARAVAPERTHALPRIEAVEGDLYIEAEPRDRSVGTVKGFAIALARRKRRRGFETYVLVNDLSKPAAVWVKESEIRLRSLVK
jgi:hypothetical protein